MEKGKGCDRLFLIQKGFVKGTNLSVGSTQYADLKLGPGDHFGEGPIVTGNPSPGTVTAMTDGMAWFLTKERFMKMLGHLDLKELLRRSRHKRLLVRFI